MIRKSENENPVIKKRIILFSLVFPMSAFHHFLHNLSNVLIVSHILNNGCDT